MNIFSKTMFLALMAIVFFYGCKKDQSMVTANKLPTQTVATGAIPDGMVMTPGGLMAKANVHLIEPGYGIQINGNHVLKIKIATGELKEDLGAIKIETPTKTTTLNVSNTAVKTNLSAENNRSLTNPPGFPGWKTYSQIGPVTTGISSVNTTWTAPAAPTTQTGQLIYIGDAVSSLAYSSGTPTIIEPILQWGWNGAFGSNSSPGYWVASNWCIWSGGAAYTTPTVSGAIVAGSTSINGIITLSGTQANGSYNYTAQFNGISNALTVIQNNTSNATGTAIPFIPLEPYAYEVLESYCSACTLATSHYPASQPYVQMNSIYVTTGLPGVAPTGTGSTWSGTSTGTANATLGEHTVVSTASPTNGTVQLWFHYGPPAIYIPTGPGPGGSYPACQNSYYTTPVPTNTGGGGVTYSFTPATAPTGYSYNANGTITVTPSAPLGTQTFTVTATNNGGTSNATVSIDVLAATTLTYATPFVFHQGVSVSTVTPIVTGSPVTSCSASPALPAGLSLSSNGTITGTPSAASVPTNYTITYSNGSCSSFTTINIAVAMQFLVYNNVSTTTPANQYFGSLSFTFTYASTFVQYGNAVVYSSNNYPGQPNPYIFWLPPGNYNIIISPASSPTPVSIIFNGTGPYSYGAPGATFNNVSISQNTMTGSSYVLIHN